MLVFLFSGAVHIAIRDRLRLRKHRLHYTVLGRRRMVNWATTGVTWWNNSVWILDMVIYGRERYLWLQRITRQWRISFRLHVVLWNIAFFSFIVPGTDPTVSVTLADQLQVLILYYTQLIRVLGLKLSPDLVGILNSFITQYLDSPVHFTYCIRVNGNTFK